MFDNATIQKLLIDCAEHEVLPYFRKLQDHEVYLKNGKDVVTIVDHNVEAWLSWQLRELLPESLVLGEEGFHADPSLMAMAALTEHVWIIDPIDGTKNFSQGHSDFAMMLTYLVRGKFSGAWIYAPMLKKMASWLEGQPVCINNIPVSKVCESKTISEMTGGEHISYFHLSDKNTIRANREKHFKECISRSCVGIEWIMMLEGELDFVSFAPGNPWDIAAGAAMVQAMGGAVYNLHQQPLQGNELFVVKSAMLATMQPEHWQAVRDHMLHEVNWRNYFA